MPYLTPELLAKITTNEASERRITVSDLDDDPRTLLFGYNTDRETHHVYLKDGLIHRVVYTPNNIISYDSRDNFTISELIPNKRLYPDACDYQICKLISCQGISIPFTNFRDQALQNDKKFKGRVIISIKFSDTNTMNLNCDYIGAVGDFGNLYVSTDNNNVVLERERGVTVFSVEQFNDMCKLSDEANKFLIKY